MQVDPAKVVKELTARIANLEEVGAIQKVQIDMLQEEVEHYKKLVAEAAEE